LEDALKSFQKKNNLDVNGTFNKSTNEKFTQQLVEKANKEDTVLNELLKKLN
ncbi:serine protease, partial [Staphylococcus cohnii]